MKDNHYVTIEEFLEQYNSGMRDPANNKWYGLEFRYKQSFYRLDVSGKKYSLIKLIIDDGKEYPDIVRYETIQDYESMDSLLSATAIEGVPFAKIIISKETELLGQD